MVAYGIWMNGTRALRTAADSRPVSRDLAVKFFEMLRHCAGLYQTRPTVRDARDALTPARRGGVRDADDDDPFKGL